MKNTLLLTVILTLTTSQASPYTIEEIREIKNIGAAIRTSGAAIAALSSNGMSEELELIISISRELNKLAAHTLKEQSQVIRLARVLERISIDAPWQTACALDSTYIKKVALVLAHCATRETVLRYKNKVVNKILAKISNDRLVGEITHALTKGLAVAAIDSSFTHIKNSYITDNKKLSLPMDLFIQRFISTVLKEAAYRIAGEMIRRNASNADCRDFADIFLNEETLF